LWSAAVVVVLWREVDVGEPYIAAQVVDVVVEEGSGLEEGDESRNRCSGT
jgi:hypothetical protein